MKNFKTNSLLTGTLVAGALISTATSGANNLNIDYLGTGGELRTQLLSNDVVNLMTSAADGLKTVEGACGEKKAESKSEDAKCGEDKKAEAKTTDAKCGEGKCGEDKKAEAKSKDAKCGEAKCGEDKKAESKSKDAKCGETK